MSLELFLIKPDALFEVFIHIILKAKEELTPVACDFFKLQLRISYPRSTTMAGQSTTTGGKLTATAGKATTTGGKLTAAEGKPITTAGKLTAAEGKPITTAGKLTATGEKHSATKEQ